MREITIIQLYLCWIDLFCKTATLPVYITVSLSVCVYVCVCSGLTCAPHSSWILSVCPWPPQTSDKLITASPGDVARIESPTSPLLWVGSNGAGSLRHTRDLWRIWSFRRYEYCMRTVKHVYCDTALRENPKVDMTEAISSSQTQGLVNSKGSNW
ncbi:hypothetical protein RRG08_040051 [Elysia crispata]|uniref:Uncharacterized protein n=1 Tax=Elysia crispata TaxID=231223 RepID=A0AAE1CNM0_9GAST|nr:hypothetical protein RRG08_040051 [Elysia crispata]